jgi:hypothetical protein
MLISLTPDFTRPAHAVGSSRVGAMRTRQRAGGEWTGWRVGEPLAPLAGSRLVAAAAEVVQSTSITRGGLLARMCDSRYGQQM